MTTIDNLDRLDRFHEFARHGVGQDVVDGANAFLRQIRRAERSFEPLFAGIPMPTFGMARAASIRARAEFGNILDQKALEGEL